MSLFPVDCISRFEFPDSKQKIDFMKILANILIFLFLLTAIANAGELRPLPWSPNLSRAVRFENNSSGTMRITDDPAEKAVRIEVDFPPGADRWAYPYLRLRTPESLADVEQIRFEFRTEPEVKCRFAHVMFGEEKPYFNLPVPKREYQAVTINVASAIRRPELVAALRIGMNPEASKLTYYIRNLEFLSSREPARITDASLAVVAGAPGAAFLQGEPLTFKLGPFAAHPTRWAVKNWKDETIQQGKWSGTELVLDPLPNGYYALELADFTGIRTFAVVPDPGKRPKNPELYFAMDSAQSWLARPFSNNPRLVANTYETVSEVARRVGLQMVRERMHWDEHTESVPGKLDWQQYLYNAKQLAKRGIQVSGVYHSAPPWTKKHADATLPADLLATYNFAKKAAEAFKKEMSVWEFWNEQDSISFTSEGAWDYAAALKAAYLGFKAGNPTASVAIGGYTGTDNFPYADAVMKNDAGDYFDIFNIHTYESLRDYPELMRTILNHLKRFGLKNRPVWFTENGTRLEGAGQLENWVPGLKMHSPDQEMLQAEFLPKAMLTLQNLGVARDFFFVLPPYNEFGGRKDWGLMRRDFTVKPGYTAFATLVDKLGTATPEGEVKLGDDLKGYLYRQKDGSQTLVYWSCSFIDTDAPAASVYRAAVPTEQSAKDLLKRNFKLPGAQRKLNGVDLFGTPQQVDSTNVTATRFPAMLDHVTNLRPAISARKPGTGRSVEKPGLDKTVVFRTELSEDFETFDSRDCASVRKAGAKFKLQIWNLSDRPKTGTIRTSGGQFAGLPGEITLPPFGKQEFELAFTRKENAKPELRIDGTFEGNRTTPLVIPLVSLPGSIETSARQLKIPRMLKPENWRVNSSGKTEIFYDTANQAIAFRTRFAPGTQDRWSYPEFLLQLPRESQTELLGVAFEVKVSRAADIRQMALMAVRSREKENGHYVTLRIPVPGENWQERFVCYLTPHLNPEKIQQLRIGVNALSDDITVYLRNIRFIYK